MKKQRERESKTMPHFMKGISGRKVTGITAVTGNVDDGGDRIIAGAFSKTIAESARRIRHLWQHGADGWDFGVTPPIAAITRIEEIAREALPEEVLVVAPDATGGLEVEREYLATPRGDEILAAYKAGIELEMSIGFETIIGRFVQDDRDRVTFRHRRDLIEIKLFDTSDVNWGMNAATVGSKSVEKRLQLLVERMRSLDVHELRAAGLCESLPLELLEEFGALCRMFGELPVVTIPKIDLQQEAKEPSRAGTVRASLTPQLIELGKLQLAFLSGK